MNANEFIPIMISYWDTPNVGQDRCGLQVLTKLMNTVYNTAGNGTIDKKQKSRPVEVCNKKK
jgi:hypothetical protein